MIRALLCVFLALAAPAGGQEGDPAPAVSALTGGNAEYLAELNERARVTARSAPRDARTLAGEALTLARRLGDRAGEIDALSTLGRTHYYQAEYDEALLRFEAALALAETLGDEEREVENLNNIGNVHYLRGAYGESLDRYSRAIGIARRTGDRAALGRGYNNLGNLYYSVNRHEEALTHFFDAVEIFDELGQEEDVARTFNNVGLVYHRLARYDEALGYLRRAQAIEERLGDKSGLALSLNNIGLVYEERGDYAGSLDYYQRSLDLRREIGHRQGIMIALHNVGQIHTQLGDYDRALVFLESALAMSQEIGVREIERDTHLALSGNYEQMGDPERALGHFKRYKAVSDQLLDEEADSRLAEMQAQYDLDKRDQEIDSLRKSQQIQRIVRNVVFGGLVVALVLIVLLYNRYQLRVRANREMRRATEAMKLAQAEREKAARAELAHVSRVATMGELASALAHELNQPLTAIMSNAQATRRLVAADRIEQKEIDEALADIVEGSARASEIIKRMRSLIRRGEITREPLELNETLRGIEAFANTEVRRHGLTLEMTFQPELPAAEGDRIQLQQVTFNLVRNAAEAMATDNGGITTVHVRTGLLDPEHLVVAVRDAGPALDDEPLQRMFDPFFTTKDEGLGMGLPICSSIIEAHGGELSATRNEDRGLTVQFTLPLARPDGASDGSSPPVLQPTPGTG